MWLIFMWILVAFSVCESDEWTEDLADIIKTNLITQCAATATDPEKITNDLYDCLKAIPPFDEIFLFPTSTDDASNRNRTAVAVGVLRKMGKYADEICLHTNDLLSCTSAYLYECFPPLEDEENFNNSASDSDSRRTNGTSTSIETLATNSGNFSSSATESSIVPANKSIINFFHLPYLNDYDGINEFVNNIVSVLCLGDGTWKQGQRRPFADLIPTFSCMMEELTSNTSKEHDAPNCNSRQFLEPKWNSSAACLGYSDEYMDCLSERLHNECKSGEQVFLALIDKYVDTVGDDCLMYNYNMTPATADPQSTSTVIKLI